MSSPLNIDPGVVHNHANGQRVDADRFFDAPAPPDPGDDPDDPTTSATRDFNGSVKKSRDHLHAQSTRHADGMDTTATVLQTQDEQSAKNVQAISPKDQAGIFTGLVKDLTSTLTGATQSLSAAAFAAVASSTQALGTGINTGMSAAQTAAKMTPDHAGAQPGLSGGMGAGGAPVAAGGDGKEDDRRAQTRPAAASGSPSVSPSNRGPFGTHGDYANTDHDRETAVQPASMAMPGGAAGLGGLGGASGAPTGKVTTRKIVTSGQPLKADAPDEPAAVYTISGAHAVTPVNTDKGDT